MHNLIPIASGKGGVGKTLLAANLGLALAQLGKTVIVVDLDLGGSNLHTVLGIRNKNPGIGHFIYQKAERLEQLVVATEQERLYFIPGDGLFSGTANLPYWRKLALLKELDELTADVVLLDLGSGTSFNTLDLFLTSSSGLIVTTPDTTAILNAYSFLKSAMLRLLQRSFPSKSDERRAVEDFLRARMDGDSATFEELMEHIATVSPQARNEAEARIDTFRPRVVMNMGRTAQDIQLGARLRQVSKKNLQHDVEFVAYLPRDEAASRAALERAPTLVRYPNSPYAQAIGQCARRLAHEPAPTDLKLFPDNEDLKELAAQFPTMG